MLLFGAWGCAKNPLLQEFIVNTNLGAGLMQGSKPYYIPALVVYLKGMYLPEICLLWFVWVGNLSRGKLIDDLSLAQFDSLVKVLSLLSTERDFRHLLTPSNLLKVFDHLVELILSKVRN